MCVLVLVMRKKSARALWRLLRTEGEAAAVNERERERERAKKKRRRRLRRRGEAPRLPDEGRERRGSWWWRLCAYYCVFLGLLLPGEGDAY